MQKTIKGGIETTLLKVFNGKDYFQQMFQGGKQVGKRLTYPMSAKEAKEARFWDRREQLRDASPSAVIFS